MMNNHRPTKNGGRRTKDQGQRTNSFRRGMVLLLVLVIVAMLSLAAYTFAERMVSEVEATGMHARDVQARVFADSGIEMIAAVLGVSTDGVEENLYHNPELFQAAVMHESEFNRLRGRFSVVSAVESDPSAGTVRFGLMDESARLNPQALLQLDLDEEQQRDALMMLPEMTLEAADSILDWIDEDDTPRQYGVETEYYESLSPPYAAKNQPFESLDELLLVRGVTPWLLFGEDANRNGLLDASENDGDLTEPFDNADGVLQLGWSAFLTVLSRESNRRADGGERININQSSLADLYDALEQEYDEDVAKFVTALRLNGPVQPPEEEGASPNGDNSQGGGSGGGGSGGGGRGGGGRQGGNNEEQAMQQFTQQLAQSLFSGGGQGRVTRGGMNLAQSPSYTVTSLYELIDAEVEAEINGTRSVLQSPWTSDPGDMQEYLPGLLDTLTTTDDEFINGRVNINQARLEVLMGVPEMTESLANSIVGAQMTDPSGQAMANIMASRTTTGWLLTEGLVDLEQMRRLDPFLTARGDVFRAQVVGHFDQGGPMVRLEVVVDATQQPPRLVFLKDLTELGWGYSHELLATGMANSPIP